MTSFVPAVLLSNREVRSGELALKNGPSVSSGVKLADLLPAAHARADEFAAAGIVPVLVLPVRGTGWSVVLLAGGIAAGVPAAQPASAIEHSTTATLTIIRLFIRVLHLSKMGQSVSG